MFVVAVALPAVFVRDVCVPLSIVMDRSGGEAGEELRWEEKHI